MSITASSTVLGDDAITVGSFDFQGSILLAEVYSQALEASGYRVHRRFALGPREFVGQAVTRGLVAMVPEYAGTALQFVSLGAAQPSDYEAATHDELVRSLGDGAVTALAATPAQNANTFVVTAATAARHDLGGLSHLAPVAADLTFGGPPACAARRLCLIVWSRGTG